MRWDWRAGHKQYDSDGGGCGGDHGGDEGGCDGDGGGDHGGTGG